MKNLGTNETTYTERWKCIYCKEWTSYKECLGKRTCPIQNHVSSLIFNGERWVFGCCNQPKDMIPNPCCWCDHAKDPFSLVSTVLVPFKAMQNKYVTQIPKSNVGYIDRVYRQDRRTLNDTESTYEVKLYSSIVRPLK